MSEVFAYCTCIECGKKFEIKSVQHNAEEARDWQAWVKENIRICPNCYTQQSRKVQYAAGLRYDVRLDYLAERRMVWIVLFGDLFEKKEELKEMGFRWSGTYPDPGTTRGMSSVYPQPKRWVISTQYRYLDEITSQLQDLGFQEGILPEAIDLEIWNDVYSEREEKKQKADAAQQRALDRLGPEPEIPETFRGLIPEGAFWNGKVYGHPGGFCIYVQKDGRKKGEKVPIADDCAEELQTLGATLTEWREKAKTVLDKS